MVRFSAGLMKFELGYLLVAEGRISGAIARLSLLVALAVIGLGSPALAQRTSTWKGGAGNWSPCPNQMGTALWDTCSANPPVFPSGNFNAVIQGGPVSATGAAVVNLSIATGDTLLLNPGYLEVTGPNLANNGLISIAKGNGLIIGGLGTTTTLSGHGTVTMSDPNSRFVGASGNGAGLIIQQEVQGQGQLGLENLTITNQSTISASGGRLTIYPSFAGLTNTGTIQATTGSTIDLVAGFSSVPFNNTGGTIKALTGGTVLLNGGTFTGGTFATTGTGFIQTLSIMNSITNTGLMKIPAPSGPTTIFEGTINNAGSIQSLGTIYVSGNATLSGAGTLEMSGPTAFLQSLNSADTLTNRQLIHGSGSIYALKVINQGTIKADDPHNQLNLAAQFTGGTPTINTSFLEASGSATLQIGNYINNKGGIIEALTGSTVILTSSSSVNGGVLTTAGSGVIESQNTTLDGTTNIPTNAGLLDVNGFDLFFQGTINNTGIISLTGNSCVILKQPSTLTGTGVLKMASTTCIFGSGMRFINKSNILGGGTIGDSNPMPITNNGVIQANNTTNPLFINSGTYGFTNNGQLIVSAHSTLNVQGLFNNLPTTGTLTGGTYVVAGTLGVQNSVVMNAANITLTGATAQISNTNMGTNALASLTSNASTGILSLQSGQVLMTAGNLSNAGIVTVGTASSLKVGGSYTQIAGKTTVDGTLTAPTGLLLQNGTLQGQGTIAAAITSHAIVVAGDSTSKAGKLSVAAFTQEASGSLNIGVGGTTAGSQYGQLAAANGVSLTGTLNVKRLNGFVPTIGSSFKIVTGSVVSGKFTTTNGLSINSAEHFEVMYASNAVTLTAVSGP